MVNDSGSVAERGWFQLKRDDGGVKRGIYFRGEEKRHKSNKIIYFLIYNLIKLKIHLILLTLINCGKY
jgi:hypothetical protein